MKQTTAKTIAELMIQHKVKSKSLSDVKKINQKEFDNLVKLSNVIKENELINNPVNIVNENRS